MKVVAPPPPVCGIPQGRCLNMMRRRRHRHQGDPSPFPNLAVLPSSITTAPVQRSPFSVVYFGIATCCTIQVTRSGEVMRNHSVSFFEIAGLGENWELYRKYTHPGRSPDHRRHAADHSANWASKDIPFSDLFPIHRFNLRRQPAVNPLYQHTQNRIRTQNKGGQ